MEATKHTQLLYEIYLSQLDCENPEVRNRKGAESGLVESKVFDLILVVRKT